MVPPKSKNELIEWLINDDIDILRQNILHDDFGWIDSILRDGFIGYNKQTKRQLQYEYMDRKPQ